MRVALLILAVAHAQAQPDPNIEIARRHFEAGRADYEAGDYQSALPEFEAARRAKMLPALGYNIARCPGRRLLLPRHRRRPGRRRRRALGARPPQVGQFVAVSSGWW